MGKSIVYHTRGSMTGVRITGGSFSGSFDIDTVNRLLRAHKYTAIVKPSGHTVFVDSAGREVSLYLFVDPAETGIGNEAIVNHRAEMNRLQKLDEAKERRVNELIANMTTDELLERLS